MTTADALYPIKVTVNGQSHEVQIPARRTLVDLLRYDLDMTGTKETCSVGVCGACTVLIDGEIAASCITLAVQADGANITTIEVSQTVKHFIQYSRASSTMVDFSVASAHRVRS